MTVNREGLASFVRFVRANPGLDADEECVVRAFWAYQGVRVGMVDDVATDVMTNPRRYNADGDTAVHVIAKAGDRRSLCGVKDPLPVVVAEFVPAHVAGYGMVVCAACADSGGDRGDAE